MTKGKGVFFHPPISVIDDGEEEDRKQPAIPKTRTARFIQTKDGIQIIVTKDGFMGLTMIGTNKEILELINVLITITMTKGHRSLFASESDLCDFDFDFDKQEITITGSQVFSLRNRFEFERDNNSTYSLWAQTPRDIIYMRAMGGIFNRAYDFYKNIELRNYVLLLGEAWGLAYERLFKASFLYSWMIIENLIKNYTVKHIDSLSISPPENKILHKNTKNTSQSIQLLYQLNKMDETTFKSLEKLREIRNKVTHDITTEIDSDQCHNCIYAANEIIYNKFNALVSPFVNITLPK